MTDARKNIRSLLLGLLAIGVGALAQNFLTSRPFLSDALLLFGVGVILFVLAFPKGGPASSIDAADERNRAGAGFKHALAEASDGASPASRRGEVALPLQRLFTNLTNIAKLSPTAALYLLSAIVFDLYALTTLKGNLIPLNGWAAFLASLVLFVAGVRAWDRGRGISPARERTPAWEILAIVLITLVAAFLRFPELDKLPFGVWYDEAINALDAIPVANGQAFPVYFEANFGRAALFFYVVAFYFKLLGAKLFALRLAVAVVGVLTVPVFYKMVRQFFGARAAVVGAFLLAVSRWHIDFSRVAFDSVFLLLFTSASIYFLAKGFRTKRATDFAIGGLALGLGLHTYTAARLLPVVIVLFLAHKLLFEFRSFRSVVSGLITFGLAALLVAAPLLKYAYDNPKVFSARTDSASVFAGKTLEQGEAALWSNISKHLLMFNYKGDPNGRHNIPGEPMLDGFTAVLFVLGACYSVWNWRRPKYFIFLALFCVMILGGVLSVDFEAPQALRSIGVIPAVFAFASLPLGYLWQTLEDYGRSFASGKLRNALELEDGQSGNPVGREADPLPPLVREIIGVRPTWVVAGSLLVIFSLVWVGKVNQFDYFTRQAANFASWNAFSTAETAIAYRLRGLKAEDYDIYMSSLYAGHPSIRFLTPNAPHYEVFDVANGIPLRTQKKGVVLFLEPQHLASYLQLKRYYPGGSFEEVTNKPYGGPPTMYEARISKEEIARIQGLNGALYAGDHKEGQPKATARVDRLDFDWSKGSQVPAPFFGEWQGTIYAPQYGSYQFVMEGSAKAALYLDESPLLDSGETTKAQTTLAKGNHAIRLEATVGSGNESVRIKWQMPGGQLTVVNSDYLFVPPVTNNGLLGKYYRSPDWQGDPAFAQIDPSIAFYFHLIPLPRPYSVEWTGKVYAPVNGTYTFGTENISASQLSIDGQLIVDNQSKNQYREGALNLQAGLHDITLRYQDRDGFSHIYLYWTAPGRGRELIPSEFLFPPQGAYPPPSAITTPPIQQPQTGPSTPAPASTPAPLPEVQAKTVQPTWETGRKGSGDGEFNEPRDVATDKDGNVYVVDTANARVEKFGPDGKFIDKWGKKGDGDGEFQEPLAVVVDSQNQVLVLDSTTGWIQRFDASGKFKGKFAGPQARFFHPRGMSIDAQDNLWIADTGGCRIVKYTSTGDFVEAHGSKGGGNGEFLEPVDVAVLPDGTILVADVGNHRIQRFDAGWRYLGQFKVPDAVAFNGGHLAVGPDGSVYATDPELQRAVKYTSDMKAVTALGGPGSNPGQLQQPVGVYVDGLGNLFVADTYNHRVQKFDAASLR